VYGGLAVARDPVEARFGLSLQAHVLTPVEWGILALVVGAGTLVGLVPAWRAYRASLADGLAPKL